MSGFTIANIYNIRRFYLYYLPLIEDDLNLCQADRELQSIAKQSDTILQQVVVKLESINSQTISNHQYSADDLAGTKLLMIPWGHHIKIMQKAKNSHEALFYIEKTIENNWSRSVLEYHIQTNLYKTQGKAKTNFKLTLPEPDSDLAIAHVKSVYNFEFLHMSEKVKESELEKGLLNHIRDFLLELGKVLHILEVSILSKSVNPIFRLICSFIILY
jgi:predicted nuclease of restriction endonuclease-like (RecB) superfamily